VILRRRAEREVDPGGDDPEKGWRHVVQLLTIDVYGAVDPEVVTQLRQKAELLGGASVAIHPFHVGFIRSPST
jgi:hypothetical protein